MSGGPTPSGSRSPWRGKLVFGLIGGFAATVLAIGLAGEFGAKRQVLTATAPAPVQQAAAVPPRATVPPQADAAVGPAPARTVQGETPAPVPREVSARSSGTRPLAIGGPPSPDQFKPAETSVGQAPTGRAAPAQRDATSARTTEQASVAAAATPSGGSNPASRKVRVIDIPPPAVEEAKAEPLGTPDPANEAASVAEAASAGSPDARQADASAGPSGDEAGRKLAAAPNAPSAAPNAQPDESAAAIPLPPLRPPFAPVARADTDEAETTWRSPHPLRTSRQEPETAAPAERSQPRPPFKPEPVAPAETTRQAALPTRQAALPTPAASRPVVVAAPARPVRTEPIPNLDRAYRQIQAERQAALRQPAPRRLVQNPDRGARQMQAEREPALREQVPRRARVALGQERRQAAPRQAEKVAPGQRLVAMHLRTYQGPDGETFDVLYRRRPADPPRSYAGGSGSSRDGVMDWLNR